MGSQCTRQAQRGPLTPALVEAAAAEKSCPKCGRPPYFMTLWRAVGRPFETVCGGCGGTLIRWS